MRVWDFPAEFLCPIHLRAQHREIHSIRTIIVDGRAGFARHPEVMRWRGHLLALQRKHDETAVLLQSHNSPLIVPFDPGLPFEWNLSSYRMPAPWQPVEEQIDLLMRKQLYLVKGCNCQWSKVWAYV